MIRSLFRLPKALKVQPNYLNSTFIKSFQTPYFVKFSTTQQPPIDNKLVEEVETKVFEVLKSAAKCKTDKLSRKATFDELGFDSLDSVELIVAMEENFRVDIQDEDAEKIQTVDDAVKIFSKYLSQKMSQTEADK